MKRIKLYSMLLGTLLSVLGGCITYHVNIPQGNEITQDQVDKLRVGLTKAQVQYLLGTPLLQDIFHNNRWDYIYLDTVNGQIKQNKKFTVLFEQDLLSNWEGQVFPLSERARLRAESEANTTSSQTQLSE